MVIFFIFILNVLLDKEIKINLYSGVIGCPPFGELNQLFPIHSRRHLDTPVIA
jgi:hypothetical protein